MVADSPVFVGIDVSKGWVDAAVRPKGTARRVNLDREGVDGLVLRGAERPRTSDRRHGGRGRV